MSRLVEIRIGTFTRRTTGRAMVVDLVLLLLVVAGAVTALTLGERDLGIGQVLRAFLPGADHLDHVVVVQWRAPRVVGAVVFGAALGVSGAIFQSLTRNPLGSPDIIGLNTGAYTGVVAVLMFGATGYVALAGGALVGGLATSLVIYLLAFRQGIQGFRLIIVGIAISAILSSINTWFSAKSDLSVALEAAVWGAGSLNGVTWTAVGTTTAIIAVLAVALPAARRRLSQLELGDDAAAATGVRVESSKAYLVIVGVIPTALVTAAIGPVAFIALAAPQIARRLTRHGDSADLAGAALVGAFLLLVSDMIAQHAFSGVMLPVGSVTVCIGGGYLVWLLIREARRA